MESTKAISGPVAYVASRMSRFILGFLIVCILHFMIPRLMPGSPVFAILGPDVIGMSQKDYTALEAELGLHDSITIQFLRHFDRISHMDFGYSYYLHQPVKQVLWQHMKPSLLLLLPSVFLSSVIACVTGILAGRFSGGKFDFVLTVLFLLLYAMPVFLLAMISLDFFSFRLDIFPLGGLRGVNIEDGIAHLLFDSVRHMFLPVMVLTFSSTAIKYLVMRNSVFEGKHQDFVLYARARGLGEKRILFLHILRYASLPLISLVGLHFAFILSGSLLVEIVFSINGMGSLIYEAAVNRDYPVLYTSFLFLTIIVLTANMITDLLYGLLDPRVRA